MSDLKKFIEKVVNLCVASPEYLESGNDKKALSEADKVLKKHGGGFTAAKVCLILIELLYGC